MLHIIKQADSDGKMLGNTNLKVNAADRKLKIVEHQQNIFWDPTPIIFDLL